MNESQDSEIRALMDPAALETRLAEARARRAKVLAERAGDAVAKRPAPPQDLPPDAVRPLVSDETSGFAGRATRAKQDTAETGDASTSLRPRSGPHDGEAGAPAQVLTLVHPMRSQPAPSTADASEVAVAPAASTPLAEVPRRRSGALTLAFAALVVGAVIGLAGAALVPGLGGWQIVVVRPAEDGDVAAPVSTLDAASGEAVRGNDAAAVGAGQADDATIAQAPTFGRLAVAPTAAAPGGTPPLPAISIGTSEAPAGAMARPELAPAPERAGGSLPRIYGPGAPPLVPMSKARGATVPARAFPVPEFAAAPPQATAEAATMPELPRPGTLVGGEIPHIDEPAAPPRLRIATTSGSALPQDRPGWVPTHTPTPAAFEPAWQVAPLELPSAPRDDRALAAVPAAPSRPAVPEQGLSSITRGASIVLHHPPDAEASAMAAQRALALAGADSVLVREVAFTIRSPNVRYYHDDDRPTAVEVADVVSAALEGDDAAARDFTGYEPAPDPGLIEVWIDGSAPVAIRAAAPPTNAAEAARERLMRSIEERLRERLR